VISTVSTASCSSSSPGGASLLRPAHPLTMSWVSSTLVGSSPPRVDLAMPCGTFEKSTSSRISRMRSSCSASRFSCSILSTVASSCPRLRSKLSISLSVSTCSLLAASSELRAFIFSCNRSANSRLLCRSLCKARTLCCSWLMVSSPSSSLKFTSAIAFPRRLRGMQMAMVFLGQKD